MVSSLLVGLEVEQHVDAGLLEDDEHGEEGSSCRVEVVHDSLEPED